MYRDKNQVVLPLEIEKNIPENDPVFKLVEICEKLDYSKLEKEYVRAWSKLNPATMFIILVYAYMRRRYSSRQFVYGKGKRKTQLQRDIDLLVSMGDKRHRYLETSTHKSLNKNSTRTTLRPEHLRLRLLYGIIPCGFRFYILISFK